MGLWEIWASLSKWQRRGFWVGAAGAAGAAAMMIDVNVLRPQEYKEYWDEKRDKDRAESVHELVQPNKQPSWASPGQVVSSSQPITSSDTTPPAAGGDGGNRSGNSDLDTGNTKPSTPKRSWWGGGRGT